MELLKELLIYIFKYVVVDARDLVRLRACCRQFKDIVDNTPLFRQILYNRIIFCSTAEQYRALLPCSGIVEDYSELAAKLKTAFSVRLPRLLFSENDGQHALYYEPGLDTIVHWCDTANATPEEIAYAHAYDRLLRHIPGAFTFFTIVMQSFTPVCIDSFTHVTTEQRQCCYFGSRKGTKVVCKFNFNTLVDRTKRARLKLDPIVTSFSQEYVDWEQALRMRFPSQTSNDSGTN